MKVESLESFSEIWLVDFEFFVGEGGLPEPLCMVASEYQSGRVIRKWLEGTPPEKPPFSLGPESLYVAYYASAELGCHLALGWGMPRNILDLFAEFRVLMNGVRPPGGFGLLGAMTAHGIGHMSPVVKKSMREMALRGGPYSDAEKDQLVDYCEGDVRSLALLLDRMETSVDLPQALLRGRYMTAAARVERNGIPVDLELFRRLKGSWESLKGELVGEVDRDYGVYEGTSFRAGLFMDYLSRRGIRWPLLESGSPALDEVTFRDMALRHPGLEPLRQLKATLSKLRLKDLAVGPDGRNRTLLSAFRSKTGRNQPSSSRFIFGAASWLRGLIMPPAGSGLAYVDWSQQEYGVAAALSGDEAMMKAYQSGDPYLAFALKAGAAPKGATKHSHASIRSQFKAAVLAVQYGMGAESLAERIGQPVARGRELLRMHHEAYPIFWRWSDSAVDHAKIHGSLQTVYGWKIRTQPDHSARSLRNFPVQANGAEMLRLASVLLTAEGVRVAAPVHDAFLIEFPAKDAEQTVLMAQALMSRASREVLGGFELKTDTQVFLHPNRFRDEGRGGPFYDRVLETLARVEGAGGTGQVLPGEGGRRLPSYPSLLKGEV